MSKYADSILALLAVVSVALLLYELDHPQAAAITASLDMVIAFIFLAEYILSTLHAPNKKKYALTHWYDLLASLPIPLTGFRSVRAIRLVRLIRLLRLLRFRRASKLFGESGIGHIIVIFIIVLLFGGVSFYILESDVNPGLQSSLDAIYWSLTTMATVGFGDITPVTNAGKFLAMALMASGVATYGCLAGFLGSYLTRSSGSTEEKKEQEELHKKIDELGTEIKELKKKLPG
jgi:voltage-gated potassium channel